MLFPFLFFSQNQSKSDSLKNVYKNNDYKRSQRLNIISDILQNETDGKEILVYAKELIASAEELDSVHYQFTGYLETGNGHRLLGNLTEALDAYFKAAEIADTNTYRIDGNRYSESDKARVKISIADVYSIMEDSKTAVSYYREAINELEKLKLKEELAIAQSNLGDEYYNQSEMDSALVYFNKAEVIFKELNFDLGLAYTYGNEGLVYAELDDNEKAEQKLNEAIDILTKLEEFYPVSVYLDAMSDVYLSRNNIQKALAYANRSLELAEAYNLKEQISDANLRISQIYEKIGNIRKSFDRYKVHIKYRDSLYNLAKNQEATNIRAEAEIREKEREAQFEIDIANQKRRTTNIILTAVAVVLALILFLAYSLLKKNKFMKKANEIIAAEKQRSDDLLTNILPEETAQELKDKGSVEAKRYESVSVLFTDFKGFTAYSEKLSPEDLVKSIDFYFSKFDEIMEKHGIEKIKTVGDAYMCACGLPYTEKEHAYKITMAGLEIVHFINETKFMKQENLAKFDIRVGINSGPVVSGVVGTKKFAYDIWGDTVNTASRMESSGDIGRVNISENTYALLKDYPDFTFELRGAIEAKGKGKIKMYFVNRKVFY